jgi:molybdopterin synthase sulfur carrier subunit
MARVTFTSNLRRHVDCATVEATGQTVREVLNCVFESNDRLRTYILDDQAALRKHMTILVDGKRVSDWVSLSEAVQPKSEVYVMQALSGG